MSRTSHVPSPAPAASARAWQLREGGAERGPFSEAYVLAGLRFGTLSPDAPARPEGGSAWRPLRECPAFAACPAAPPRPPSATPASPPLTLSEKPPWDPRAIGWLGLAFSPLWAGVMAALNARRLGTGPVWRPVLIAAVWLIVGETADLADPLDLRVRHPAVHLALQAAWLAAGVGLLWLVDLRPQARRYLGSAAGDGSAAAWAVPVAAGAPLAALTAVGLGLLLLVPPEPREVCRALLGSRSFEAAEPFATARFRPVLAAVHADGNDVLGRNVEFLDEGPEPDLGGYYVRCRVAVRTDAGAGLAEIAFHLIQADGRWKVEEGYLTAWDAERYDPPVRLSEVMAAPPPAPGPAATAAGPAGRPGDAGKGGLPPGSVAGFLIAVAGAWRLWEWKSGRGR